MIRRVVRCARQAWRYLRNPWLLEARVELDRSIAQHPAGSKRQRGVS